ncbi:MAG: RHS repeat domain-containing protein, partial [Bacteroidota bacterium]
QGSQVEMVAFLSNESGLFLKLYRSVHGRVTPRLNSPFVNFEVLNGEVKKTRVFDATMELLSETENVYSNVDVSTNGPNQNLYQGVHLYQIESSPTTTHNNVCLLNNGPIVGIADMQTTGLMIGGVMQQTNNCAQVNGGPVALTTFVDYQINPYKFHPKWKRLDSTITKTYENGDELINTVTYSYNQFPTHYQLTEIESTDSKGKLSKTEIIYAGDAIGTGAYTGSEETPLIELRDRNQISEVVMAKRYYDNALIGVQQKKYKNNIGNTQEGKKLIRTNQILAAKGTNALEVRRVIQSFDDYGNPIEVFTPLGAKTYFVWGYYGKLLIAKVDNRVETIPQNDVDAAITASNNDTDTNGFLEGALKSKLQILRDHFSSSLVSTYTYDPGVGVTSMTDALGYTMTYVYDQHNRLLEVRDADGNLVSENEYNLREN